MISTSWKRATSAAVALAALALWGAPARGAPNAAAADARVAQARAAVREMLDEALPVLRNPQADEARKLAELTEVAERRFDLRRMSALVLGRTRRALSPDQRDAFRREFERHLTATYAGNLARVSDEAVEIGDSRLERNGDVTVASRIVGGGADGLALDYRLRSRGEDPWRVIDVSIEGVSVARSFRAQVREIVAAEGPERLIEILREKNDRAEADRAAPEAGD